MKKRIDLEDFPGLVAILKASGVAAFLPQHIKEQVCHSAAIDLTNYINGHYSKGGDKWQEKPKS